MRRHLGAGCVLLALGGLSMLPAETALASCAGPQLSLPEADTAGNEPATVMVAEKMTVQGRFFVDGCDDTGGGTVGCGATDDPVETEAPMTDVTLTLRQGGRSWDLGTRDAGTAADGDLGQVDWPIVVPADVRPGPARLVAGTARLPVVVAVPAR